MEQIPTEIQNSYESLLFEKEIPRRDHPFLEKWLRYYPDFCVKYHYDSSRKESLPHFIQKLHDKKQNDHQQRQALDAISLYYEIALSGSENKTSTKKKYNDAKLKKDNFRLTNADWTSSYNTLDAEIKLRHYSPKTLRAYRGWARQFQSYTKSKDPKLLSSSDVKDFLTFLAVKQKVSAASQNQAFNSRLFIKVLCKCSHHHYPYVSAVIHILRRHCVSYFHQLGGILNRYGFVGLRWNFTPIVEEVFPVHSA